MVIVYVYYFRQLISSSVKIFLFFRIQIRNSSPRGRPRGIAWLDFLLQDFLRVWHTFFDRLTHFLRLKTSIFITSYFSASLLSDLEFTLTFAAEFANL